MYNENFILGIGGDNGGSAIYLYRKLWWDRVELYSSFDTFCIFPVFSIQTSYELALLY